MAYLPQFLSSIWIALWHPQTIIPTLNVQYEDMHFPIPHLQKQQIQKSHHMQPSGDGFILNSEHFFQNSETTVVV